MNKAGKNADRCLTRDILSSLMVSMAISACGGGNNNTAGPVVDAAAPAPAGLATKISDHKRAYASTTQDRASDPANAIDGQLATRWASGVTSKAWLMVDLGAAAQIDRVEIDWETAWSSRCTIEVSNDRVTWSLVGAPQTNPAARDGVTVKPAAAAYKSVVMLGLSQAYRYLRVNSTERGWAAGDGSQYGISILELAVFGAGGLDNPAALPGPSVPAGTTYVQVWSDEFDSNATKSSVDAGKWSHELGDGCDRGLCGWGNGERQYYTDSLDNVFRQDGLLNIQLRNNDAGHAYTSGRISTLGKFQFTYGRVAGRIRMNMPNSSAPGAKDGPVGVWGAFWMLGFDVNDPYVGWPNSGEQDIMENIGYSWWHSSSLHGPGYSGGASIGESYNKTDTPSGIGVGNFAAFKVTDWHTYEVEWEPTQIVFKLDGVAYRTILRGEVEARGYWVFDKPNFIVLNVAYDGAYPSAYRNNPQNFIGAKTPGGLSLAAEAAFPHTMQVDWVRVSQRQ
jgi:beta-glucanase (GH16 family)